MAVLSTFNMLKVLKISGHKVLISVSCDTRMRATKPPIATRKRIKKARKRRGR